MSSVEDRTFREEVVMTHEEEIEDWRQNWHRYIDKVADELQRLLAVVALDPSTESENETTDVRGV